MILTTKMQEAGIVQVLAQNYNGSYVCLVELPKVNLKNNKANPRRHSKSHGNKISKRWNKRCVRNPILRYKKSNGLTSIDGRHTTYELLSKTVQVMTCDVHFNITDAEAAVIFHDLTVNNKRISTWDAHACALTAKLQHAVEIQTALSNYDFTTPNSAGYTVKSCDITAFDPLLEAWESQDGVLEALLYILYNCYTDEYMTARPAKSCEFLRGLIDIIQSDEYSDFSKNDLADLLMRRTAGQTAELASAYANQSGTSRPNRGHYFQAFCDVLDMPVSRRRAA